MIVFQVHWGAEYTSKQQMNIYKVLEGEGVDVVIGSHPHRLQPMEIREIEYNGQKKNQAVIWSTVNLYQGQTKKRYYVNIGSVFKLNVVRKDGIIKVTDLDYNLVYNLKWKDAQGDEAYKVILMAQMDQYQANFPENYATMKREYKWANETLNKSVKVKFSAGTASKSN